MTTRVLIMAGGTGGHVFPALAVADELKSQHVDVAWMGTQRGIEAKLVPASGYPLNFISIQGLRGNGILGWLLAPFKLIKAVVEAVSVIKQFKPDAVLGLGGFASGPGAVAAKLMGTPLVIHEQNAIPGLTNRLSALFANHVLEGFSGSFKNIRHAQYIGNPVRESIEELDRPQQRMVDRNSTIRILVLGGSLGAKSLNTLLPEAFGLLETELEIKHQCGVKHSDDCKHNYEVAGVEADVITFIDDMSEVYAWADLVICRAGALTIAELAAAGVASLLVPYPYAVDDHQTHNASVLVNNGAAVLVQEKNLTIESFAEEISKLVGDRTLLLTMAIQARKQAKTGTAKLISALCLEVAHG